MKRKNVVGKYRDKALLMALIFCAAVCCGCTQQRLPGTQETQSTGGSSGSLGFDNMYLEGQPRQDEPYRKWYDLGSCRTLTEDVHIVLLFLEDDESGWDDVSILTIANSLMTQAMTYIQNWGAKYGHQINLTNELLGADGGIRIHYNGIIGDRYANTAMDLMPQVAIQLGYDTPVQMHEAIRASSGKEQVAYMLFVNKLGTSYATQDRSNDDSDMIEYTVNLAATTTGVLPAPNGFVHEFLHLFGAEDMYADGSFRVKRAALADQLHYFAIMRRIHSDLNSNTISEFTAYTVGWLDELPPQYETDDWWS